MALEAAARACSGVSPDLGAPAAVRGQSVAKAKRGVNWGLGGPSEVLLRWRLQAGQNRGHCPVGGC